jgi:hypothetical protein
MKGPPIESKVISAPIKVNKVNIETIEHPKMASIETTGMSQQYKSSQSFCWNTTTCFLQHL